MFSLRIVSCHFCLIAPATTQSYTLSLHDALPISMKCRYPSAVIANPSGTRTPSGDNSRIISPSEATLPPARPTSWRSEEHTSELQSLRHLVCRLLLEKKKKTNITDELSKNTRTQV